MTLLALLVLNKKAFSKKEICVIFSNISHGKIIYFKIVEEYVS